MSAKTRRAFGCRAGQRECRLLAAPRLPPDREPCASRIAERRGDRDRQLQRIRRGHEGLAGGDLLEQPVRRAARCFGGPVVAQELRRQLLGDRLEGRLAGRLVALDQDQVDAAVGLHRSARLAGLEREGHLVERRHHAAARKAAERRRRRLASRRPRTAPWRAPRSSRPRRAGARARSACASASSPVNRMWRARTCSALRVVREPHAGTRRARGPAPSRRSALRLFGRHGNVFPERGLARRRIAQRELGARRAGSRRARAASDTRTGDATKREKLRSSKSRRCCAAYSRGPSPVREM